MNHADDQVLAEFLAAFGRPQRPLVYGNPNHCDECYRANELLMSRAPEDLDPEELREPSKGWFFAWMGPEGWRYFLPGFVRLALVDPSRCFGLLVDRFNGDYLSVLSAPQRRALFEVLDYGRACGYASDNWTRTVLRRALRQLQAEESG